MQNTNKAGSLTPKKAWRSIRFHVLAAFLGLIMLYPLILDVRLLPQTQ